MTQHTQSASELGVVDVHAHFVTEWYVDAARAAGHLKPDGMPGWPQWSADEHLRLMDSIGVQRAILSISSPGVHFGDDAAAAALARRTNEFAAEIVAQHPDRFGFFASVPLPDVDAALTETAHAVDTLGADGVVTMTNVGGRYVSDASFEPFLAELERRSAPLFVHPTSPPGADAVALGLPRPLLEFLVETTRNLTSLIMGGTLERHPDLQLIASHSGGFVAMLVERMELFAQGLGGLDVNPDSIRRALEQLWFDMAGVPAPTAAPTLAQHVGTGHLLFGSDYCWTPAPVAQGLVQQLDANWPTTQLGEWRGVAAAAGAELFGARGA